MPLYEYRCLNGHREEHFEHAPEDRGCRSFICGQCGHSMGPAVTFGTPLTASLGGWPRWIHNMGNQPVWVEDAAHHRRLMKERGLEWVAPRRGEKGCWA